MNGRAAITHGSRAVAELGQAVARTVFPRVGRAGRRSAPALRRPVWFTDAMRFAVQRTSVLQGVRHGERVVFHAPSHDGQPLVFDWWIPHRGVCIDEAERPEAEIEAKAMWCARVGVVYVDPAHAWDADHVSGIFAAIRSRAMLEIGGMHEPD